MHFIQQHRCFHQWCAWRQRGACRRGNTQRTHSRLGSPDAQMPGRPPSPIPRALGFPARRGWHFFVKTKPVRLGISGGLLGNCRLSFLSSTSTSEQCTTMKNACKRWESVTRILISSLAARYARTRGCIHVFTVYIRLWDITQSTLPPAESGRRNPEGKSLLFLPDKGLATTTHACTFEHPPDLAQQTNWWGHAACLSTRLRR